jgi:competence protein ComFC
MRFHDQLLDFVLPKACCLCEALGSSLCGSCRASIAHDARIRCIGCGLVKACDCSLPHWALNRTYTLVSYEAPVDRLIAEMKFQSKQSIGKVLGDLMGAEFAASIQKEGLQLDDYTLVPVPLSNKRFLERGFNQARTIALAFQKQFILALPSRTKLPIEQTLRRRQNSQAQSSLDREQRLVNLQSAYEVIGQPPTNVILIDDVMTTGATLNVCATLLKAAGTKNVWAVVAARTEQAKVRVKVH